MHEQISNWFDEQLRKSGQYLVKIGFEKEDNKNRYTGMIPSDTNYLQKITIYLKDGFPIEYPRVYIDFGEDKKGKYLHVESFDKKYGNYICLFDQKSSQQFYSNGINLIQVVLEKAESFLNNLLKQEVTSTPLLLNEFDAYWKNTSDEIYSLLDEPKEIQELTLSTLFKRTIVSNSAINNKQYFQEMYGFDSQKIKNLRVLFLPIEIVNHSIPYNNDDIVDIFKKEELLNKIDYFIEDIYKKKQREVYFFFKVRNSNPKIISISLNLKPIEKSINTFLFSKKLKTEVGLLEYIMSKINSKDITRINVIDINYNRIFRRGGSKEQVKEIFNKNTKVSVVGCGSLGSLLSFKLIKSGVLNQLLIDGDTLSYDNIARHQLGSINVNRAKATVLEEELKKQFPLSNINSYNKTFQSLNEDDFKEVLESDFIIFATGDEAEAAIHFLLEYKRVEGITSNVMIVWFEAFASIGHALILDNNNINNHKNIRQDINFMESEVDEIVESKEFGCIKNYSSYTFINSDYIVNNIARFVLEHIQGNQKYNHLTICGDIENYKGHVKYALQENLKSFSISYSERKDSHD